MTAKLNQYVAPSVVSFSESEVLDLLGPSCVYPDSIPTSDPSAGGGGNSGGGKDPKKQRR
jgi:hypothetical protein